VTPEYPPDTIGGGGVVVQALVAEYMADHKVEVFSAADSTRSWFGHRDRDNADKNVFINRYPLIPFGRHQAYLRSVVPPNPSAWFELRNDLVAWRPDVAHLHGYGYSLTDLAALALARRRVPYIFTVHGLPSTPMRRNSGIRAAYRIYQRFGVGRAIRGAREVTAISAAVAEEVGCRRKVHVIPNGISPLPGSDARTGVELREQLGLPDGLPVVVAAGRLSITKGFDVLIQALEQVQVRELACVVAGSDGGVADVLARLAAKARKGVTVKLPGRLHRQELADLFALADVVVVPSREEPFGLVALEALASHKRLVASNTGGLREFLHPGVATLVPPGDAGALAAGITLNLARGALSTTELQEIAHLLARYSWSAIAQRYMALMANARQS